MVLRRGFKTDAEWFARDVRKELKLAQTDPLCPWSLAQNMDHKVVDLSAFEEKHPIDVARLRGCTGANGFSAVTIHKGGARLVILNDCRCTLIKEKLPLLANFGDFCTSI